MVANLRYQLNSTLNIDVPLENYPFIHAHALLICRYNRWIHFLLFPTWLISITYSVKRLNTAQYFLA